MVRTRLLRRWVVAALAVLCALIPAYGQTSDMLDTPDRFAYIIGNSAYETFQGNKIDGSPFNLVTPVNDARRYAEAMETLGWEVLNDARFERSAEAIRRELEIALNKITPGSEVVLSLIHISEPTRPY